MIAVQLSPYLKLGCYHPLTLLGSLTAPTFAGLHSTYVTGNLGLDKSANQDLEDLWTGAYT